ncbi:MAG: nucleotide sugar dehydrogenase [Dehalococcoidia bacterium]
MKRKAARRVAVIGLGSVGLPLAAAFGRALPTVGFDTDPQRVRELQTGYDRNGEVLQEVLAAPYLRLTDDPEELNRADFFIVAVPTPVDHSKRPDLSHLVEASRLVGRALKAQRKRPNPPDQSDELGEPVVVYESTVYPGCPEEVCIPFLGEESGLQPGRGFKVGYSPERANPGDPEHTLDKVVKVVSAQDSDTVGVMVEVYRLVVNAGVYEAPDIRTAEAAKVIENVQRDLNIALMNELAMLFHRLGLDTREVLKAARTKWNFLPFEPGLVGGHCIPVDPYYLTHKAEELGCHPEVILAGRRINDQMGVYVARETIRLLTRAGRDPKEARVLVLGVAFKENVSDTRNTRVVDLVRELESCGVEVQVHDPLVGLDRLKGMGFNPVPDPFGVDSNERHQTGKSSESPNSDQPCYNVVVVAVPHKPFRDKGLNQYVNLLRNDDGPGVLVDVKAVLPWRENGNPGVLYRSL